MNLILACAIQKSYDAGLEYLECLGKLSSLNRSKKPILKQDTEALVLAYRQLYDAQMEIDAVLTLNDG